MIVQGAKFRDFVPNERRGVPFEAFFTERTIEKTAAEKEPAGFACCVMTTTAVVLRAQTALEGSAFLRFCFMRIHALDVVDSRTGLAFFETIALATNQAGLSMSVP